ALVFADFDRAALITARPAPASLDRVLRRASGSMGPPSNAGSQMRKQLQLYWTKPVRKIPNNFLGTGGRGLISARRATMAEWRIRMTWGIRMVGDQGLEPWTSPV